MKKGLPTGKPLISAAFGTLRPDRCCIKITKKIDLIFTKSVSIFARNTIDFLNAIRQPRSWGVDVYFENERILLSKERTETAMSIYAAFM